MGKAKAVGAVDDQGVRARYIQSAFDNRRRQKDIVALFIERAHAFFDLRRRHLPVRGDIFHFRHFSPQIFFDLGKIGYARHDKKALPPAIMFTQQRFTQHHGVPWHNIGTHGQTVDRRRLDDGQLAQARHGHLQRPRDRSGRQRQHMHVGLQRFQLLLMIDAEPLFFVNNDEAKPFEFK